MSEEEYADLLEKVEEIREALLGDYDKKGLISRVRSLEAKVKVFIGAMTTMGVLVAELLFTRFVG